MNFCNQEEMRNNVIDDVESDVQGPALSSK